MAGEYDYKPGGSLKFKGGGTTKKKKKSSTSEKMREEASSTSKEASGSSKTLEDGASPREEVLSDEGVTSTKVRTTHKEEEKPVMTESERRYEEIRKQRLAKKVRKEAMKSHKDRVSEFNSKLESMSEHHDLPRIGPG